MPDNPLESLKEKLSVVEGTTVNICPNGHPYLIGNCGKPTTVGKCNECGAQIGGKLYKFEKGNKIAHDSELKTQTGYLLKHCDEIDGNECIDRLTRLQSHIIRSVLHITMLTIANRDCHSIETALVKVQKLETNVTDFLLGHLEKNINEIKKILLKSSEAVCILLHKIFTLFFEEQTREKIPRWLSSEDRRDWEKIFTEHIIDVSLEGIDETQKLVACDDRLADNPFFKNLIELQENIEEENVSKCTYVWLNREEVTLESILQTLTKQNPTDQINFLISVMSNIEVISEIQFLPEIIDLSIITIRNIQGKFTRSQLRKMEIREFREILNEPGEKHIQYILFQK